MIAPALPADPLDHLHLAVDQDAEPADVDRLLDALDRIVERRLAKGNQNETSGPAMAARFPNLVLPDRAGQGGRQCPL